MAEESAKLQAAHNHRGIYEVLTEEKDDSKEIAGARLKLEMDIALAMPCIVREDCRGKPLTCPSLTDASSEQSDSEKRKSMWKSEAKTYGPRCW